VTENGVIAEHVTFTGDNGDQTSAYAARPVGDGRFPGVIVVHHMPGWDDATKQIALKFAFYGYNAICPNLFHRFGEGSADDVAAVARAAGGKADEEFLGDARGALGYLRALPTSNGKVGIIGFCSGGRQSYLAACKIPELNAAVDCWGGRVIGSEDQLTDQQPVAPIDYTSEMDVPLLGIFGNEDSSPTPEDVDKTEEILKKAGKEYEFFRYDEAGHGFFAVDRPGYRPVQATEAWGEVFRFYKKHLT